MRKRRDKSKKLIKFHYTYLLMGICFILSGYFINLIVFTSLILVHELGHYLVARVLKFKVSGIIIYPYGGITKIDDLLNRNSNEELLVAVSGVIIQYLFYLVIIYLYKESVVREYTFNLYTLYNSRIIFFNLLPIYPLDGGRIVNLLLSKVFSYNFSNKLTIFISIVIVFVIININLYTFNYSNIMIYLIISCYIVDYIKNIKYLYNRFLLERYLYKLDFDKVKVIDSTDNMYKDRKHLILFDNNWISEGVYLNKLFGKKL